MLGIIIQLAISWLIIWLVEKRNLSVLGFRPAKECLLSCGFLPYYICNLCFRGFNENVFRTGMAIESRPCYIFTNYSGSINKLPFIKTSHTKISIT